MQKVKREGCQSEKESTHHVLDADKTSQYRSTVARLNCWVADKPDIQYAVRECAWIMFEWQTAARQLTMQSDGDWAGDKITMKSVSAGTIRCGRYLLRSWSKDQTVITMNAACMAAQQAMGTENLA